MFSELATNNLAESLQFYNKSSYPEMHIIIILLWLLQ